MKKEIEKIVVKFGDSGKNMLIVSERQNGESKSEHEKRIEWMKKMMIERARMV